ncbi:MAG: flagellar basal body L-ring protein FlgH [Acetobacteraceae bacterium]|nr:flagellar basal body L-ring protein FlgH [Acetobacteraceae bacterium]
MKTRLALLAVLGLTACGTGQRIAEIGRGPQLAPIENPGGRPISMPMPEPQVASNEANSLWRAGSRTFLRDQRASAPGDLVTILVQIEDRAQLQNRTQRSRNNAEQLGFPRFFGVDRLLPAVIDPARLLDGTSTNSSDGNGQIQRQETLTLRVAATVTQLFPNGNMAVAGRQQVRVNQELRDVQVSGVIRPQDIASDNTIRHDRLAEARIALGGRGTISDVQQPRYGQQFLDAVLPF